MMGGLEREREEGVGGGRGEEEKQKGEGRGWRWGWKRIKRKQKPLLSLKNGSVLGNSSVLSQAVYICLSLHFLHALILEISQWCKYGYVHKFILNVHLAMSMCKAF